MIDDPLTEGPELSSKLLGRAQGFYGSASQKDAGPLMAMNFAFLQGSSLTTGDAIVCIMSMCCITDHAYFIGTLNFFLYLSSLVCSCNKYMLIFHHFVPSNDELFLVQNHTT